MPGSDTDAPGRGREYAKLAVRRFLHRRHLDLVSDPHPSRVAATLHWLGADMVLDIGTNIGQYASALRSSGYRGRIVSCEPLPDAFAVLRRRSRRDPRWAAVQSAVGSQPGTLDINVSANSYSSSILPMAAAHAEAAPGSEFIGSVTVPVTTVGRLVTAHGVDPGRALLKVDTQGYESEVLDGVGDRLGEFAAVQLEMSFIPMYEGQQVYDDLAERLVRAGFGLHGLDPGMSDPRTGRLLQADALFVQLARRG